MTLRYGSLFFTKGERKMTISKTLKAFTSSLALGIGLIAMPTTAHAQIPVTDVASIGQDAANFVQTAAHYGSQVAHYANQIQKFEQQITQLQREYDSITCLLYTSPSPRDATLSRMPSSA